MRRPILPYLEVPIPVRRTLGARADQGPGPLLVVREVAAERVLMPRGRVRRLISRTTRATFTLPRSTGLEMAAQREMHVPFRTASSCQRLTLRRRNVLDLLRLPGARESRLARGNLWRRSRALLPLVDDVFRNKFLKDGVCPYEKDGKQCKYPHLTKAEYDAELASMKASAAAEAKP